MKKWLIVALSVLWVLWELISAGDGNKDTWPLTQILIHYLPPEVVIPAAVLLAAWLPIHFAAAYGKRKRAARRLAMSTPTVLPPPLPAAADASNRAWRTLMQGLLLDVLVAVGMVLVTSLTSVEWTRKYWLALAALLLKTTIQAVVSYLSRKIVPPPSTLRANGLPR